ncbi:MAG TPA: hypothetical protein PLU39_09275 [Armatimonadota bacterium]|nr:hypothetical protein [Armatimonadota bacterium]HOM80962.1 hypothetical protein [Armatimonadota bacterium]HPO73016.1 hypothetical protein [Armatimonadota bacterium]HPT98047.1 hypothetical protein [Armatimonadota bacterium]
MHDVAFPLPVAARSPWTRWALALLAGLLITLAIAPAEAAPRKRSAKAPVRIKRAAKPRPASHSSANDAMLAQFGDLSLDQVIALLRSSADFWERSGTAIEGCDPMTAIVLSLACRQRTIGLVDAKARMEGNPASAASARRELKEAVDRAIESIRAAYKPQQTITAGMEGGMPGMGGPEMGMGGAPGMPGPMDPAMGGGPGMPPPMP